MERAKKRATEVDRLESLGWESEDSLNRVHLSRRWSGEGRRGLDDLRSVMKFAASADISTQTGFRFGLAGGELEVLSSPSTLSDYYSGTQLETAERIRDGDSRISDDLEADWNGSLTIDLAKGLYDEADGFRWKIVRSYAVVLDAIAKLAWWELGSLISNERPLLVLVLDNACPRRLITGSLICCSDSRLNGVELDDGLINKRQELAVARGEDPRGVVLPEEVIPRSSHEGVSDLVDLLRTRAAAAAWGWLSNSIELVDEVAQLEFFGLQRVKAQLSSEGLPLTNDQVQALALYQWATSDVSVDRILAIRQVVSIYGGSSFLESADDVRRAAEPVYLALRRDAVSEALANTREAGRIGLAATRAALEGALASAKSVGERALASLAALGALVITAATSENLSDSVVANIALGIALFTLFLAIWNALVEGPISAFPLKNLREEISSASILMTDGELDVLTKSTSVQNARRRVLVVRILAPTIYIAVAAVAAAVAHPYPKGFWDWIGLR